MRSSGWILPVVAAVVWILAVLWPGLSVVGVVAADDGPRVAAPEAWRLFGTSLAWAAGIAIAATLVGWVPGRLLGRLLGSQLSRRWFGPFAAALLAPICLPAYLAFYAWWQTWPADSALYGWAVEHDAIQTVKAATLALGLVGWSWPIAAWCVAGFAADTPAHREEMLALDGASWHTRLADRLRCDGRGLALATLIVFVFVFNNTTSFDLAQIYTYGYELRVLDNDQDAGPRSIVIAALPAVVVTIAGLTLIWRLFAPGTPPETSDRPRPVTGLAVGVTAAIWLAATAAPFTLFALNLGGDTDVPTFMDLYGRDLGHTIVLALACGLTTALVTVGLAAAWQDHRRPVRIAATVQAIGWLAAGVVPAIVAGVALEAAYNRVLLDDLVYTTPLVLVLGHIARFGFVGALLARWLTMREPRTLADLRRLDDATDLRGYVTATWPRLLAAATAAGAIAGVLSLSELSVTARLQPPGYGTIAAPALNAMHYQRPDTVLLVAMTLLGAGVLAAVVVLLGWWPLRRFGGVAVLAATFALGSGCGGDVDGTPRSLDADSTFGSGGRSLGQFSYPRALAADLDRELLYVVDKTARVQRFGFDGTPQHEWRMPARELGKPTGIAVHDDGRVFVADTHYNRVIAYDAEGREQLRFGVYGMEPGQFIYPTDVAFGPQGRVYVSEYGGNDRISVFDADGTYLFHFGELGSDPDQFARPQGLAFSHDGSELYIADACNHRIVVADPEGTILRILGDAGRGPGQFAYPYDVMVLEDGSLLICEFGNNRIQRLAPDGQCLGLRGRAGPGPGELQYPWGVDGDDGTIFVLDSGNNRVHVLHGL